MNRYKLVNVYNQNKQNVISIIIEQQLFINAKSAEEHRNDTYKNVKVFCKTDIKCSVNIPID